MTSKKQLSPDLIAKIWAYLFIKEILLPIVKKMKDEICSPLTEEEIKTLHQNTRIKQKQSSLLSNFHGIDKTKRKGE